MHLLLHAFIIAQGFIQSSRCTSSFMHIVPAVLLNDVQSVTVQNHQLSIVRRVLMGQNGDLGSLLKAVCYS